MEDLNLIHPGIPHKDGCPVLTRIKAFVAYEGQAAVMEYQFRDRVTGNPIDLTSTAAVSESGSEVISESAQTDDTVLLRIAEFTAVDAPRCRIERVEGTIISPHEGRVRARIPAAVYGQSGIYRLSWGFVRDEQIVLINEGLLSMERSLFGFDTHQRHTAGPPTLNELRMQIMDSSPSENQYLLDDLEFNDEQIVLALSKPIQQFNEMPPRIRPRFNSRNFPWKSAWLDASAGFLYQFAAAHYRRNAVKLEGGGQNANDKDKEREYLQMSQLHLKQWDEFRTLKKLEISMHECAGSVGSVYGATDYHQ